MGLKICINLADVEAAAKYIADNNPHVPSIEKARENIWLALKSTIGNHDCGWVATGGLLLIFDREWGIDQPINVNVFVDPNFSDSEWSTLELK